MLSLAALLVSLSGATAQAEEVCDARAVLAGRIMALRQAEAPRAALDQLAWEAGDRLLATDLIARALAQEIGGDTDAREAASYHFAADVYEACRRGAELGRYMAA